MVVTSGNLDNAVHVVAGAIGDAGGPILTTRRPDGVHQGGLWEFPGGKLEPGERPLEGLGRELAEELGITVQAARPLIRVRHAYADRAVLLDVYRVQRYTGTAVGREGQPLAWLCPAEMDEHLFPAADRPVIRALQLPDRMLITGADPARPAAFLRRLELALTTGIRLVQLRAPGLRSPAYIELARAAYECCARHGAWLLLNADPALAERLPCQGLHLTSARLRGLASRPGADGQLIGASCHDAEELSLAAALGLDYALLSPVRPTASHPGGSVLGWSRFAALVDRVNLPVYALGGLGEADLPAAWKAGAQGIAAIRGLWPTADPAAAADSARDLAHS